MATLAPLLRFNRARTLSQVTEEPDFGPVAFAGPSGDGGGGGDLPTPEYPDIPGKIKVPKGYQSVRNPNFGVKGDVREYLNVPVYDYVDDPSFIRPRAPSAGRQIMPWEREAGELGVERLRQQIAGYDPTLERELGMGQLGLGRDRLALDTELGRRRQALEELVTMEGSWYQKEQAALAKGQLAEAIEARKQQQALAQQRLGLEAELGYANSRRQDVQTNIGRAEAFGEDVDGALTGQVGRKTASAQQREFGNLLGLQDRSRQREEFGQLQVREDKRLALQERQVAEGERAQKRAEDFGELQLALNVARPRRRLMAA